MEEILASIRLIISDDAKKVDREDGQDLRPALLRRDAAPAAAAPEEEVFDLTEELVFPEEQSAPAAAPPVLEASPAVAAEEEEIAPEEVQVEELGDEPSPEPASVAAAAPDRPAHVDYEPRERPAPEHRQEPAAKPSPAQSRSLWSRRELPGSPPASASPPPRAPSQPAAPRQAQRSWPEDVQMPISDGGPVSLITPGETQVQIKPPSKEAGLAGAPLESPESAPATGMGEKEEAAVALLAESLALTAASAMDEEELQAAGDVDFARLDDERKSNVTESFANAIERESARRERTPLPTLLDEVFGQDFAPEPPAQAAAEDWRSLGLRAAQPEAVEWPSAAKAPEHDDFLSPALPEEPDDPERSAEKPRREAPFAQVQFVGASQPALASSGSGGTLEDAVRDMLRPLLAQWLNENMPRILEKAIREEMATRGYLPKVET
jgi:cell pole-organizing protein PopZ